MKAIALILSLFTLAFCGCDTMQRQAFFAAAKKVIGKVAVAELTALVQGQLDSDSAHAAANAAWSAVDIKDIFTLINDATGHKAPAVAQTATKLAQQAVATGTVSKADARNAVAQAISAAATSMQ